MVSMSVLEFGLLLSSHVWLYIDRLLFNLFLLLLEFGIEPETLNMEPVYQSVGVLGLVLTIVTNIRNKNRNLFRSIS